MGYDPCTWTSQGHVSNVAFLWSSLCLVACSLVTPHWMDQRLCPRRLGLSNCLRVNCLGISRDINKEKQVSFQ
ncbi:uncharacterized protein BKA55DRAFT_560949 [Fusarium redolens]|uniref:Uncharacterized protein n=1 Tax=Fusarium redolens TaxID=48865 RepID=A0A9P9HPI5_FUSRE|nr:uncharacterized protein BKA55DRAFT_560949 [Fusarium redolens]KAH7261305.1 hypothetical protein BKA55DRAFT_560949 [Fusarium redolens]